LGSRRRPPARCRRRERLHPAWRSPARVSPDRLAAQYAPVVRHLEARLGAKVELLVVRDYAELTGRVVRGDIDVAWLPALEYVRAARLDPGLRALAVPVEREKDPHYQGIILAKKGRGIDELADLAGTKFCYVSPSSASGHLYPRQALRRAGSTRHPVPRGRVPERAPPGARIARDRRCDAAATYEACAQRERAGIPARQLHRAGRHRRRSCSAPTSPPRRPAPLAAPDPPRALSSWRRAAGRARSSRRQGASSPALEPVDDHAYDLLRQQTRRRRGQRAAVRCGRPAGVAPRPGLCDGR
jgi:hypothetical protein